MPTICFRHFGHLVIGVLMVFSACGKEADEPSVFNSGAYTVSIVGAEGISSPVLEDGEKLRFYNDATFGTFLELDGRLFSDVTEGTSVVYRWLVTEPTASVYRLKLKQGEGEYGTGVYEHFRFWEAALALDIETQTGMLDVSFHTKQFEADPESIEARRRFQFRRTGSAGDLPVINDPYIHTYDYTANCYDPFVITGDGHYIAKLKPFPDLRTAMATSIVMECNHYEGLTILRGATGTSVEISGSNAYIGRWKAVPLQVALTDCGRVTPHRLERVEYGSPVSANSNLQPCRFNGGVIYHSWD